jgi:hypothetical protein
MEADKGANIMRERVAKFEMVIVKSESTSQKYTFSSNPRVMERFTRLLKSPSDAQSVAEGSFPSVHSL